MARKKKTRRTPSKKISALYKKALSVLGISGVGLVAYCYFAGQSDNVPVIVGPNYPKRTPGVASQTRTYAVYDQLAKESSRSKNTPHSLPIARLLPPDEQPQWEDAYENIDQSPPLSAATDAADPYAKRSEPAGHITDPLSEKQASHKTAISSNPKGTAEKTTAPILKPFVKPKPDKTGSKQSAQQTVKTSGKISSVRLQKNPPQRASAIKENARVVSKKTTSIQVGEIVNSQEKAKKIIQSLIQKGSIPKGKKYVIQKAIFRGKAQFRVILVGTGR